MKLSNGKLLALLLLIPTLAAPGFGQTTGTITGSAMDPSGALIPGVEVSVASRP